VPYERELFANTSKNANEVAQALLAAEGGIRRVLDIPCGEGALTRRLVDAGYEVHSADIEPLAKVNQERFTRADMDRPLPYEDGFFDAVVCVDGIEHLTRPFDFVAECGRVLKPGGTFIVCTPNISSLRSRWRYFLTGFHNKGKTPLDERAPDPLHHITLVSFPDLRYRLHTRGFELTEIRANIVKAAAWLYAPAVPLCRLATAWVFRREEKDPAVRAQNRQVARQLFSVPVLFGELLVLKAKKRN
jgi:SAM-dependent methyltransferase